VHSTALLLLPKDGAAGVYQANRHAPLTGTASKSPSGKRLLLLRLSQADELVNSRPAVCRVVCQHLVLANKVANPVAAVESQ
jgi:hypothetical protein